MIDRFTDVTWTITQRYFMVVGAIWMITTLIGPQMEGEWIILSGAALALLSLVISRPKPSGSTSND